MSNAIEFYCPGKDELGVPALRPVIFLDGKVCGFLRVVCIERAACAKGSSVVLQYDVSSLDETDICPVEDIESIVPMGSQVSIRQLYNAGVGETQVESVSVFEGNVEGIRTQINGDGQSVVITARDFIASMERMTVFGRRYADATDGSRFMVGMQAVFNEDGEGNASKQKVICNGKSYTVFAADDNAKLWSYGEIILYLLSEYVLLGLVGVPCLEELEAVTGYMVAEELNLEGKNVAEVIELCCKKTGVQFAVEPSYCFVGVSSGIVFYRPGKGRAVELNCQYAGNGLDISRTNVIGIDSDRGRWPVTDRFIVQGEYKEYESTFTLVPAWDSLLEGLPQSEYEQSTSSNFDSVADVYRKWCLNEAGDYGEPAFDFSKVFQGQEYLTRRRVFERAITGDKGYYLEVSFDDGVNWQEFTDSFDVLDDQCGVWLSEDELGAQMWTAIGASALILRITATVASDVRVNYSVSNGAADGCAPVTETIETDSSYAYRKVMPTSVFYDQVRTGQLEADQIDDSNAIAAYCKTKARLSERVIDNVTVNTAVVGMHYCLGDRVVCSPESRDILGIRRDRRSEFVITGMAMDIDKQQTRLEIVRRRAY
ncbi:MAG: hypothetical protein KAJ07_01045 [Planctomycetes bacterium]|nr:hypothetical protein [Planctomycetota bacterium]